MSICIGIDLGTTNTVMAVRAPLPKVIQNRESHDHTPSVVSWNKGASIIGQLAVDNVKRAPKDTIISIKRLMGRAYSDAQVQRVRDQYQYEIIQPSHGDSDGLAVRLGGKEHTPVEVSSLILKKIKDDAEMRLNEKVEYAVVTVPAYFTEKQKEATRRAGMAAGLTVQRILDEPTAAAIAFSMDNLGEDDGARNILVYDLGGGTFDVSVLTYSTGTFVQLNIEGDMWLGGDNFDFLLMKRVLDHVQAATGIDPKNQPMFMAELKRNAEQAKKQLSSAQVADIFIPTTLRKPNGDLEDVEMEITRQEFENMISKDIERSITIVHKALEGAQLKPDEIDYVLLVGGSSMIPLVRRGLAELFGDKKLRQDVDPMKCVAFGASILSARLGPSWSCGKAHPNGPGEDKCVTCGEARVRTDAQAAGAGPSAGDMVYGLTALPFGIRTVGDKFAVILPKGTPYPTPEPVVQEFHTPEPNMRRIRIEAYCGESALATDNDKQCIIWVPLPLGVPEDTPVDVAFCLDKDGILEKVQVLVKHRETVRIEAFVGRADSNRNQLEKALEAMRHQRHGKKLTQTEEERFEQLYDAAVQALNQRDNHIAERKIAELRSVVDKETDWRPRVLSAVNYADIALEDYDYLIDPPMAQRMRALMQEVRSAAERGDRVAAEAKADELWKMNEELPALVDRMMFVLTRIIQLKNAGDEVTADRLRSLKQQADAALKRGDIERFKQLVPLIAEITGQDLPLPDGRATEGLLKKK